MKVTQKQINKAYDDYEAAKALAVDAEDAAYEAAKVAKAAFDVAVTGYVAKADAAWDDAKAAAASKAAVNAAVSAAWDKFIKLKREYDNGIKSTED